MADLRSLRVDAMDALGVVMATFDPGAPAKALLDQLEQVTLGFHTLAAASLLADGNSQKFFLNLTRCAENGRLFLRLLRRRGLPLPRASRNVPLLGALACGDFARAAELADLSRQDHDAAHQEYEHEHLWARALQLLTRDPPAEADVEPVLAALEPLAPDAVDRIAAVRALLAGDVEAFAQAMVAAARQYEAETEKRAKCFTTPVTTFAPHRFLWLEGLALLRLGERAGLPVELDLRYCPRLARVPMTAHYEGDWAIESGEP